MKAANRSRDTEAFYTALGKRVYEEILRKGYASPYEFWVQKGGDHFSRAAMNFLIAGKSNPTVETLRKIAKLLGVKVQVFFDFE